MSNRSEKPNYKIGDIVKRRGTTASWKITVVRANHGGHGWHRYWGTYVEGGGSCGAYEDEIEIYETR